MKKLNPLLLIVLSLTLCGKTIASPILDEQKFATAKESAKHDKHKGQHCYMECQFDPYFGERFHAIMGSCFKALASPEVKTFETVLLLDTTGQVTQAFLNLDTNLSQCALKAISALVFPEPPFSPYHARITVNLK